MKSRLSPSMMCADIFTLRETLRTFENEGIEYLHLDIMDGHFVPNITLGTDYCRRLASETSIAFDYHFMTEEPEVMLERFSIRPGDIVSIHAESTRHLYKTLQTVKEKGALAFAALCPATPLSALDYVVGLLDGILVMTVEPGFAGQKLITPMLDKIGDARAYLDAHGKKEASVEADGNVSFENAEKMKKAGADLFVGGTSSIFSDAENLAGSIRRLRQYAGGET